MVDAGRRDYPIHRNRRHIKGIVAGFKVVVKKTPVPLQGLPQDRGEIPLLVWPPSIAFSPAERAWDGPC